MYIQLLTRSGAVLISLPSTSAELTGSIEALYWSDMTIKAIVHKSEEGGYWAEVPALPGCVTQAETMDELRKNLREAIEGWLEAGTPESKPSGDDQILELAV